MGYEERLEARAYGIIEELETFAASIRNRSWDPPVELTVRLLNSSASLAGAIADRMND